MQVRPWRLHSFGPIIYAASAHLEVRSALGKTPLMKAANNGRIACLRALLDARAAVSAVDASGETALIQAAYQGRLACARELLARGADPRRRVTAGGYYEGKSALDLAEKRGKTEVAAVTNEPIPGVPGTENGVVIFKILRNALDAPERGRVSIVGRNPEAIWFDGYEDRVIYDEAGLYDYGRVRVESATPVAVGAGVDDGPMGD